MTAVTALALLACDLGFLLFGKRRDAGAGKPDTSAASVVIPNWNGRDLLEKYLPSVVAALAGNPRNEIIVVDNGSGDGSAEFVRQAFPSVRLVVLDRNLGFGGGSNRGFREARNDIVVLLNSDMRVAPDFLQPLLDGFTDALVFSVSCQIFFSDPSKKREETGLTQGWWAQGALRVRHREDPAVTELFPCFYGGGGSCAFDRRKFLELGAFDELLRPFYMEDTDIGFLAWKRGWKVLYQPKSRVWHEHRGTIGKSFSPDYIDSAIGKNTVLFTWKNIHEKGRILGHLLSALLSAFVSMLAGPSRERCSFGAIGRAFLQLRGALVSRWHARSLSRISDTEAFRRPMGGYYRDRFDVIDPDRNRLAVLFVSPYAVSPPVHGGGVFMNQAIRHLAPLTDLHLLAFVDRPAEIPPHEELRPLTRSMEFVVRDEGQPARFASLSPAAVREFHSHDFEWILHRRMFTGRIDVLQLEYTNMGQYACDFHRIACMLFEHDVFFQSIARGLSSMPRASRVSASYEYLRALRYELNLLPKLDRIQTCTEENRRFLLSYLPGLDGRIDAHLRAGIDGSLYSFKPGGREPHTLLFLGSFRHAPNAAALSWFVHKVMPLVLEREPRTRLTVIGSDPPPAHSLPAHGGAVELLGFLPDIGEALGRYSLFVCPILSGSGVRVKLLEAFAAGMPVVSTRVGAEGLGEQDGLHCRLADTPRGFAEAILNLFENPEEAEAMARRAREYVLRHRHILVQARELEQVYRETLSQKARSMA